ncbi:MAG: ABC transporter ATP-binding protein [Nitrospiraceae bacterium]|jgi:putative ABC transport system ATP-binding protein|nr:ABC transporter ATP-binding protein [Nitrospiraceae bacterium]
MSYEKETSIGITYEPNSKLKTLNSKILCLMEDITKTYQIGEENVEVLTSINLRIERGEFVAIMGTSGSGKTTLMNLIGCLDVPTSGHYILADREVSNLTDDELSVIRNEHIGFVFQNFYLLPYATVLENVLLPTLYISTPLSPPWQGGGNGGVEKHAMELLRLVGLEERAKFRPNQLSGGQQQRVAIARALVNNPELLLCDEPTGQLDSKTAAEIMNLLTEMNKMGKTVIVVTHDQNIASYTKRIIQIKDGAIVS